MPGRANQMSASDAYNMSSSRWTVPFKVLSNKRALDLAFQQHIWKMQNQSQKDNAEERQIKLKNEGRVNSLVAGRPGIERQVLTETVKILQEKGVDPSTPEGQQSFQQIYQALMKQVSGDGAASLAAGTSPAGTSSARLPNVPEPVGAMDPRRMSPDFADYGIKRGTEGQQLDETTARKLLQKAGGDANRARAMARRLGYSF